MYLKASKQFLAIAGEVREKVILLLAFFVEDHGTKLPAGRGYALLKSKQILWANEGALGEIFTQKPVSIWGQSSREFPMILYNLYQS